jgi:LmbE family N-acetylglucosaminyl deacetylase
MRYSTDDVSKLGTILTVWAHPDDESWCAAGLLAIAINNGQRVVCITATRGDAGKTADEVKWPQTDLANIRTSELEASLKEVGITEHHWLDYLDGKLVESDSEPAIQKITEIIKSIAPDTIITFGQDGLTGHTDHIAVFNWTLEARSRSNSSAIIYSAIESKERFESPETQACNQKFNLYFNTENPTTIAENQADICLYLSSEIQNKKLACLKAHASQTTKLFNDPDGNTFMNKLASCECFMLAK